MIKRILLKMIPLYRFVLFEFCKFLKLFNNNFKVNNKKKKVIIISNLGLGDAMNFICVANKYRKVYSKAFYEITILCTKASVELLKNETDFDRFIVLNLNNDFCNSLNFFKKIKISKILRKEKYDILIDTMWPFTILPANIFASFLVNAKEKIAIINKKVLQIPIKYIQKIYTRVEYVDDIKISNIEMYILLPSFISKKIDDKIVYKKTKHTALNLNLPEKYYVIFPTSTSNMKNWDYNKYIELINLIYDKTHLKAVFCGTLNDKNIIDKISSKLSENQYINILGETSTLEFIEVIKRSKFVITNDTSAYHIAVIEEIPVTIITGGYTYDSFVKYDFKDNNYKKPYIVTARNKKCFNCHLKCIYNDYDKFHCLKEITTKMVWDMVKKMIESEKI